MFEGLLFVGLTWLTSIPPPSEPLYCDYYAMPQEVIGVIEREDMLRGVGLVEVRDISPRGDISALFINWFGRHLLLEGMFIEGESGFAVCTIGFAEEIDDEGHILFEWRSNK